MYNNTDRIYSLVFSIIAIVLVIYIYTISTYHTSNKRKKDKIIIKTEKGIYYIDPDACVLYLSKLKKNLILSYKNSNKKQDISKIINSTHNDFLVYINGSFIDDKIKEQNINLIRNNDTRSCSNFDTDDIDITINDILSDIDIATEMINYGSNDFDKKLNLIKVHRLIKILNKTQINNTSTDLDYEILGNEILGNEILGNETSEDVVLAYLPKKKLLVSSRNTTLSQNNKEGYNTKAEDGEIFCHESENLRYFSPLKCYKSKANLWETDGKITGNDSNLNIISGSSRTYKEFVPMYNIEEARKEHMSRKLITTDINAKRSLISDYDYLDE